MRINKKKVVKYKLLLTFLIKNDRIYINKNNFQFLLFSLNTFDTDTDQSESYVFIAFHLHNKSKIKMSGVRYQYEKTGGDFYGKVHTGTFQN